ncbi:TPA: hypothetical protein ACV5BF_004159, partial [Enterobacter roggenkampii]
MPCSGMETPAEVTRNAAGEGRRDRLQPLRIDSFCLAHPIPCKAKSPESHSGCRFAPSEWSRQGVAVVGAYLRVSGP